MVFCPICPAASLLGGYLGSFFGIQYSNNIRIRMLSAVITAGLLSITLIALKVLFNISLCGGAAFTAKNMIPLLIKTAFLGMIYSIGINYIINKFISSSSLGKKTDSEEAHDCCGKRQSR